MFSDYKSEPKVSEFEDSISMQICPVCGTLFPRDGTGNEKCPTCTLSHRDSEQLYTKFKRSE